MNAPRLRIVVLGLSITSSWGNGHATTWRALLSELARAGHDTLFLERDVPWYAAHRDLPEPPYGRTALYGGLDELRGRFGAEVREADAVVVGSFVPDGAEVGDWVLDEARGIAAFYDIDTPVTLARLERGEHDYLRPAQVRRYDLYLSFTGGPTLERLERRLGSPMARVLYCSVDPAIHRPEPTVPDWDLGYMGTYSPDRQPALAALLLGPARELPSRRFVVAGPQYPADVAWPPNCERIEHLPPDRHRRFYNRQRWTLNLTRADMRAAGWSPSVRLFEAAACGTPVVGDRWDGLQALFEPGREIVIADGPRQVLDALERIGEDERRRIGERARERVLASHTAEHRAREFAGYVREAADVRARRGGAGRR